jgi:hypothetical protein
VGELFPTSVRYSGTSIGYQLASTLGAGFTPLIATALVVAGGGSLWMVACLWIAFSGMSLVALLAAKDRSGQDIQQLDGPAAVAAPEVSTSTQNDGETAAVRA